MKTKTIFFSREETRPSIIDEKLTEFIKNEKIIKMTCAVSSGNFLGGGGIVYTFLCESDPIVNEECKHTNTEKLAKISSHDRFMCMDCKKVLYI